MRAIVCSRNLVARTSFFLDMKYNNICLVIGLLTFSMVNGQHGNPYRSLLWLKRNLALLLRLKGQIEPNNLNSIDRHERDKRSSQFGAMSRLLSLEHLRSINRFRPDRRQI